MKETRETQGAKINVLGIAGLCAIALGGFFLIVGCAATGPSKFESALFESETNWMPRITVHTNIVSITNQVQATNFVSVPVVQTVTITNEQNVIVPQFVTNIVQREIVTSAPSVSSTTNLTQETNQVAVVQMKKGATIGAIETGAGVIGDMFGVGGLVKAALGAGLAGFLTWRNRQFAVNAAVQTASVAQTAAQTLAQNIETLKSVLATTPQGQQLQPLISSYLMNHQREAGVIDVVADIVDRTVDEPNAKAAADAILATLRQVQGTNTAATKA